MDRARIETELVSIVSAIAERPADQFSLDTLLAETGMDSLALVETVFQIEERYGIAIPFNANEQNMSGFGTLGSLMDMVVDLIIAKEGGAVLPIVPAHPAPQDSAPHLAIPQAAFSPQPAPL